MKRQKQATEKHDDKLRALELRKAGYSYAEIAADLGKHKSSAWRNVKQALKETLQEPADDVRKLELIRLDAALRAIWPMVEAGNLSAIDRLHVNLKRRAELLGLDAPAKHQVDVGPEVHVYLPDNGRGDAN